MLLCPVCNGTQVMSHHGEMNHVCYACQKFIPTHVPIPPMLTQMISDSLEQRKSRYFALYYEGTNATWTDGWMTATFSFFSVYQPLTDHLTIAIALFESGVDATFGSDDEPPTHALVCDRNGFMYVGKISDTQHFLRLLNPPPNSQLDLEALLAQMSQFETLSDFQAIGMFEMLGGQSKRCGEQELINYLNQFATPELVERLQRCNHPQAAFWRQFPTDSN